ncbi:sensor histidine kinase [Dietzia sp.]|uniref:sensor histidine kinase n=1 Tax=Dietzia sp. TaxID=1871616 RepID=UPI002FD9F73A
MDPGQSTLPGTPEQTVPVDSPNKQVLHGLPPQAGSRGRRDRQRARADKGSRPVDPGSDAGVLPLPAPGVSESATMPYTAQLRATRPPMSLRRRVALLAATTVGVAVALMTVAAYFVVTNALVDNASNRLERQVVSMLESGAADSANAQPRTWIFAVTTFNPDLEPVVVTRDGLAYGPDPQDPYKLPFEIGDSEREVIQHHAASSLNTAGGKQILAVANRDGSTLVLAQDLGPTRAVLNRLAIVLSIVGALGIVLAAAAGTAVGRTGLAPVGRLTRAVERVARTDDLRPIPVAGDDELARLTYAFNQMLHALQESRERQSRLVADAGHELKTPLTSLRTNAELLIALDKPNSPDIPEAEKRALERDIIAQIEELSTLVGDLVNLARHDAGAETIELIDLEDVVESALERARRRRKNVTFDVQTMHWYIYGDESAWERAVLNLCDNAAKWSPEGGTVSVRMAASGGLLSLDVSDQGPGIPESDRALVFERFYRATESRTMPGSGLGLAIVRQVVVKHGGTIEAREAEGGGAQLHMEVPGTPERPADSTTG